MENKSNGYRGYVTCRSFGGLTIPVPVQSKLLRDYCASNGMKYHLHLNENRFENSFIVLNGIVGKLGDLPGVVMPSIFMLPTKPKNREKIYQEIISNNKSIHFVLEGMVLDSTSTKIKIEQLLRIYYLSNDSDQTADVLRG